MTDTADETVHVSVLLEYLPLQDTRAVIEATETLQRCLVKIPHVDEPETSRELLSC